ncbi:MAG: stage III sporulation protein AC [Clostridia bacterium]|nr:stage III sporulation protein AC [Clostridia bacterium]
MDVSLILKIAGIGILVSVACQVLSRSGRDDQSTMVSIAGVIIVLFILVGEMGTLFETVREVFEL